MFGRDLQDVLQERLFDTLGIPPERWEWLSGATIRDATYLYPDLADSYTYLDPPYEIAGQPVRSGPGWVVISASDLARFGHLNATDGIWNGQRVIEPEWLRGHSGGNRCGVAGESTHFTALAVVTAETFDPHLLGGDAELPARRGLRRPGTGRRVSRPSPRPRPAPPDDGWTTPERSPNGGS